MAYVSLTPSQTDRKSPIDDVLMDTIRTDLDDLNSRVINGSQLAPVDLRLNGIVEAPIDQFDCIHPITVACNFVIATLSADNSGVSGSFTVVVNRNGPSGSTSQTVTLNANAGAFAYNSVTLSPAIACQVGDYVWANLTGMPAGAPENLKVRLVFT